MEEKVLIADDDITNIKLLTRVLDMFDFTSDFAQDAESTIKKIQKDQFQIIITDKNMPGINYPSEGGMDVLEYVKTNHPSIPVIMLTGYASIESVIQAMKLGAFDYLTKPFNKVELGRKLNRASQYRRFLNPTQTLNEYHSVYSSILEVLTKKNSGQRVQPDDLDEIDKNLDNHFRTLKKKEELILNQREALASINGLASQLLENMDEQTTGFNLIQQIHQQSLNNI